LTEYEKLLKTTNNITNIKFYYIYDELFFSPEISNIIHDEKKEKYFQLKEIEKEKNEEEIEINQMIKVKNAIIKFLYNKDLTYFINKQNIYTNDFKNLILEIYKYNKIKYN
jgi:hypothetical protein